MRTPDEGRGLFESAAAAALLGECTVSVPQRAGRRARVARVQLRACEVELCEPKRRGGNGRVRVNAVLAREVQAPAGEAALHWLVLTSESVGDADAARRVLQWYTRRWRIEEFHKAWKSGTRIEERRLQSADNLERLAVMLAFVAVRLLQLREVLEQPREEANSRRCDEVLDEVQWKVLWLTMSKRALPKQPPSLLWAYQTLAKLGGWGDSKRTGRAGWQTLWEGWFALNERVDGFHIAQQLALQGKM